MSIRPSTPAITLIALAGVILIALIMHSVVVDPIERDRLQIGAKLVHDLGLTDLSLFTDARYTRHPTQADLHSAFQDHPLALDHFPSGSLMAPPIEVFSQSIGQMGEDVQR